MPLFPAPPLRTQFPKELTPLFFARGWEQWFQSVADGFTTPRISELAPALSTSPGKPGQIAYDANFLYVAVAKDTWKRIALVAF